MAIKDYDGNRITPKQKAADIMMYVVTTAQYHLDEQEPDLSPREREEVRRQLVKYKQRIERMLGFLPGSWPWA